MLLLARVKHSLWINRGCKEQDFILRILILCNGNVGSVLYTRDDRPSSSSPPPPPAAAAAAAINYVIWRRRRATQADQEEDAQASHDLLESSATAAVSTVSAHSVPGSAWESRAGRDAGTHANAGQSLPSTDLSLIFEHFYSPQVVAEN